jgi:Icc-related predicted phosphoesterase
MTLIFISDTHGKHTDARLNAKLNNLFNKNPDAIICHCGDISSSGYRWEVEAFFKWYSSLPFKNRILIAGNHDFLFEYKPQEIQKILIETPGITYLEDSGIEIDGINFWGSPVTPRFFDWAFNRDEDIVNHWDLIPNNTDVLITHGPPYGILDFTIRDKKSVGCPRLLAKIEKLSLSVHAFGHIHEGFGSEEFPDLLPRTLFVNASYLNSRYEPVNDPIVVNL